MKAILPISMSFIAVGLLLSCTKQERPPLRSQNPSPMTESIRTHDRVSKDLCVGTRKNWQFEGKTVQLFMPELLDTSKKVQLVIHFHGIPEVTEFAICEDSSRVLLTVNAGSGSSAYQSLFKRKGAFSELLDKIKLEMGSLDFKSITLSAWSAGYGAIRAIILEEEELIDQVVLLDGLHTSYIPERVVLSEGGKLDSMQLETFLQFGRRAVAGEKKFIIAHSSIFPATFSSTTECTEYLIHSLGFERTPTLKQGPGGMQQLGQARGGKFMVLSYAGNTAPDHVDYLHELKYFLDLIEDF